MKNKTQIFFLLYALGVFFGFTSCEDDPVNLNGTITGIVTNSQFDKEPIDNVKVSISGAQESKTTGSDGKFEFVVEAREEAYIIQFSHSEFISDKVEVDVLPESAKSADISLDPIVPLELSLLDLDFGSSSSQESFNITNLRNDELDFSITTSADFVIASPNSGKIGSQNTTPIKVEIDREGLELGGFNEQVIVNVPNRGSVTLNIIGTESEPELPLSFSVEELDFSTSITTLEMTVTSTSSAFLNYDVEASANWLVPERALGSISGFNSDIFSVSVDRSKLGVGDHQGNLIISIPGIGSNTIPVSVSKLDATSAVLVLSDGLIDFGSTLQERTIEIFNEGDNTLAWEANVSDTWISLGEASGSLPSNNRQEISLFINRGSLNDGEYEGQLSFTSNGGEAVVVVKMNVNSSITVNTGGIVVTSGLRAYYTFEDGTTKDEQGSFDGVAIGVTPSEDTPGASGRSMAFDGFDDFIQLSSNPMLNANKGSIQGTIALWVKTATGGTIGAIPYSTSDEYNELVLGIKNDQLIHSIDNWGGNNRCCSSSQIGMFNFDIGFLLDDSWHHWAVVYYASTTSASLYVDGIKLSQDDYELFLSIDAEVFRIGADYETGTSTEIQNFSGLMDNVRIYNRPLNASEVQEIFDSRQ